MRRVLFLVLLAGLVGSPLLAQDPVKVDSRHYSVLFENDQVRVLKIRYGPKEKSVMHEHPGAVAVFQTELKAKFTLGDGTSMEREGKADSAMWTPAEKHLPENLSDQPFELVLVEVKAKAGRE
jgi:quercetin dioxygenase-like cupin family protein